jgi:DNA invertase Pin-like site-specific DNA recombinase
MLRIGYVRLGGPDHSHAADALRDLGCHVVRVEEQVDGVELQPVLSSILDFIGEGVELVALRLEHLGRSSRALLELIERLDHRGATLVTSDPAVTSAGPEGETLRGVLRAMAALEPTETPRRRPRAPAQEILALQRAGMGPVEIARRLGVSRMTVWRKLRSVDSMHPTGA